jgi:hypothetical protein
VTDRWQRARALARRQWDDEAIISALAGDNATDAEVAEVEAFIRKGHPSLERAREEGKGLIRDEVWEMAFGMFPELDEDEERTDQRRKKVGIDPVRWQALYALGRAHLGYGETHDVAAYREQLRKAKAAMRSGKTLKVVAG